MVVQMYFDDKELTFIETLYKKEALLLYRYTKTIFDNASIAEEAVQETFIIVCLNYTKVSASLNPEGWIMNTHKNVCRNMQKRQHLYLKRILSLDQMENLPSYSEPTYNINDDLSTFVSSDDYTLLRKIILEGYSHKDVANELNISIDVCKKRFQRAKERFKKNFHQ